MDCVHTPLYAQHWVIFLLRCWIRPYPLCFVALADFELLDTTGLAPLCFVAVVDTTVPALSAIKHHAKELFDAPAAVSTPFSVAD